MVTIYISLIIESIILFIASKVIPLRKLFPIILMITFALVLGCRHNVGVDYPTYEAMYYNEAHAGRKSLEPIWISIYDILNYFNFKSRIFFLLTSFIIVGGYYRGFKLMSPNIYLSFIIFIACGLYGWSGNAVRQCCAQAILFAGTPFLLNRKWFHFILMAFLASMLHYSAIVGTVFMLLCIIRVPLWGLISAVITTFVLGNAIMHIFADYMVVFSTAVNRYHYDLHTHDSGVSSGALRYAYNIIGAFILIFYNKIKLLNKNVYIYINLTILGICWYNVFFMFMEINRLTNYCFPFITILLPYAIKLFKSGTKIMVAASIVILMLLFVIKSDIETPYDFDLNLL